jgi:23S rRNA (cytosine1962-C5)-methyltransferase
VACGIADPENGVIQILSLEAVRGFDAKFFAERLTRALSLRRALGFVGAESAYRLVNAEGDELPGFSVDRFGEYAVVCAPSRPLLPFARLLAEAVGRSGRARLLRGVVIKVRGKDPQDRSHKDEIIGAAPPEKYVVHELGVPYEVHLLGSLNVGLFPDMREQRRHIARFVTGRRVLNTFAYTGALSIAAARAGADSVTSVDLSSGVLAWARENFRLSGFAAGDARFRFEVSDVKRFMQKEVERGNLYDTILLDPPTVSAARASQWSMKKDYPQLLALATKLLPPSGASCGFRPTPAAAPPCSATSRKASACPAATAPCWRSAACHPTSPPRQDGPNRATWKSAKSSSQAGNMRLGMKRILVISLAALACSKAIPPVRDAGRKPLADAAPSASDAPVSLAVDFSVENCPRSMHRP